MKELQIFKSDLFEVSVKMENGEILFDAEMVARCLGFTTVANSGNDCVRWSRVNEYLKFSQNVGKGSFIPEPAVYKLAFKASNETAEKFQDWLAIEVLPSIRKHGGYITPQKVEEMINDPDTMIVMLNALKKERQEKSALLSVNKTLVEKIETDKPRVDFAIGIETSATSISVREYAKIISKDGFIIGEKRLFTWFRENNFLMWNNEPYQKYIEQNLFEVKEGFYIAGDNTKPYKKTLITGKGQIYFGKKLLEKKNECLQVAQ